MHTKTDSTWLKSRYLIFCLVLAYGSYDASSGQPAEGRGEASTAFRDVGKLLLATCQFPVSADVEANAEWIRKQMQQAHKLNAEIVHFSECALSGYAGVDHKTLDDFDWAMQRKALESILCECVEN